MWEQEPERISPVLVRYDAFAHAFLQIGIDRCLARARLLSISLIVCPPSALPELLAPLIPNLGARGRTAIRRPTGSRATI